MAYHSYIVLRGKNRGTLLERRRDGRYEEHIQRPTFYTTPDINSFHDEDVAPLTEEECVLLDAIRSLETRFTVYSSPGKLKWGLGLKVGDTVSAGLPDKIGGRGSSGSEQYATAIIRWCGQVHDSFSSHRIGVEIEEPQYRGYGDTDGRVYPGTHGEKRCFTCERNCGLFLTLAELEEPPSSNGASSVSTQEHASQLERELAVNRQETRHLQQQLSSTEKRLQEQGRQMATLVRRERETVARKDQEIRRLEDQLAGQREHHVTELRRVREEHQRQLRQEQMQHQHPTDRINTTFAHLRGETVSPQALEPWELPREEVHISQTILGTGGWGYVARGTFQGQRVAIKCLHRGILSAQNAGRMRREIGLMAQVCHPNLLLLIGAVLTAEGEGPLIVTELLDRSLRSAYEEGVLEERSKVPVLRDVASALTHLHSHRTPMIHRDVSSANVLLEAIRSDCQWKAKLSDFGSANLSHLASTPAEGAAVYAAPEVSTEDRSRQTAKIDVYSFGVLVCEVCLCRFPPDRRQFPSMLVDVRGTAPHMFPLSCDCTSHAHQDRPAMRQVLERLDQLND